MSSLLRHVFAVWYDFEVYGGEGKAFEDALCAVMFNTQGFLHETVAPHKEDTQHVKYHSLFKKLLEEPIITTKITHVKDPWLTRTDDSGETKQCAASTKTEPA